MPVQSAKPTVRRIFDRVSESSDAIDRPKVEAYLKQIGVGSGFLGGQKITKGADGFMSKFDSSPKDGKVTWSEFVANAKNLVPPGLSDGKGRLNPALVGSVFDAMAGKGVEKATPDHVADYVKPKITGLASMFAGAIAEATGKVAADALDLDGDGAFTRDDLSALVADINAELDKK